MTRGWRIEVEDDVYGWMTPAELEDAVPVSSKWAALLMAMQLGYSLFDVRAVEVR